MEKLHELLIKMTNLAYSLVAAEMELERKPTAEKALKAGEYHTMYSQNLSKIEQYEKILNIISRKGLSNLEGSLILSSNDYAGYLREMREDWFLSEKPKTEEEYKLLKEWIESEFAITRP